MAQYENMDTKLPGLVHGSSFHIRNETWRVAEQNGIDFGDAVYMYEGADLTDGIDGWKIHRDVSTITLDADLITDNTITTTINGTAVATPFNNDHDTTMDDHKDDIEAAIEGITVTLTDTVDNRVFRLFYEGNDFVTVTSVVTGGASQAGTTVTFDTDLIFGGIARRSDRGFTNTVGEYPYQDAMNVVDEGMICVVTSKAVSANTAAYTILDPASADQGKFTDSASGTYTTNCVFRETITAAGTVIVDVNKQNKGNP